MDTVRDIIVPMAHDREPSQAKGRAAELESKGRFSSIEHVKSAVLTHDWCRWTSDGISCKLTGHAWRIRDPRPKRRSLRWARVDVVVVELHLHWLTVNQSAEGQE